MTLIEAMLKYPDGVLLRRPNGVSGIFHWGRPDFRNDSAGGWALKFDTSPCPIVSICIVGFGSDNTNADDWEEVVRE